MMKTSKTSFAMVLMLSAACAGAQNDNAKLPNASDYASSAGQSIGDIVTIKSDMYGFEAVTGLEGITTKYCAGAGTEIRVNGRNTTYTFVEFKHSKNIQPANAAGIVCPRDAPLVLEQVSFRISNDVWDHVRSTVQGVTFGALVVPFKFRLGGDRKLVTSSTIAPYFGYRFDSLQGASLMGIPIVSVGMGFVPVYDSASKTTQTKTGLSAAIGFIVTSEKNPNFNGGFLFGKDYLGREDRQIDPSISKAWVSLWLGVTIK